MNKVIGYARISSGTGTQILDPQVSKLQESGCDQIFSETISFETPKEKEACKLVNSDNVGELIDLLHNEAKVI